MVESQQSRHGVHRPDPVSALTETVTSHLTRHVSVSHDTSVESSRVYRRGRRGARVRYYGYGRGTHLACANISRRGRGENGGSGNRGGAIKGVETILQYRLFCLYDCISCMRWYHGNPFGIVSVPAPAHYHSCHACSLERISRHQSRPARQAVARPHPHLPGYHGSSFYTFQLCVHLCKMAFPSWPMACSREMVKRELVHVCTRRWWCTPDSGIWHHHRCHGPAVEARAHHAFWSHYELSARMRLQEPLPTSEGLDRLMREVASVARSNSAAHRLLLSLFSQRRQCDCTARLMHALAQDG